MASLGEPTVSVVIPVYNGEAFLGDAIERVLKQTYRKWELIIVDDGSTDRSYSIAKQYAHVAKVATQANAGGSAARQAGLELASGELIAALDADDLWLEDKLERQVAALRETPDAGLCYCDGFLSRQATEGAGPGPLTALPRLSSLYGRGKTGWQFQHYFRLGAIATSSMVFRRQAIERVGGYDPNLRWGDFDLAARVLAMFPGVYVAEPLMVYRMHNKNTSSFLTPENVLDRLEFKRLARVAVLRRLKEEGVSVPGLSSRVFWVLPPLCQVGIILWWRLVYGASRRYALASTKRYLRYVIASLLRRVGGSGDASR